MNLKQELIAQIVPEEVTHKDEAWNMLVARSMQSTSIEEGAMELYNACRAEVLKNIEGFGLSGYVRLEDVVAAVQNLRHELGQEQFLSNDSREVWKEGHGKALDEVLASLALPQGEGK